MKFQRYRSIKTASQRDNTIKKHETFTCLSKGKGTWKHRHERIYLARLNELKENNTQVCRRPHAARKQRKKKERKEE